MVTPDRALSNIPDGLREPLLKEFKAIISNFMERRWLPAELSGGRFCEIVYTILDGHAKSIFPSTPNKPANFAKACQQLENNSTVPRSFRILIPRLLPALYEIRNNRNVGHVGGDVQPDLMDCSAVVSMSSWILAEMIRVFHNIPNTDAQQLVDSLAERRLPVIWVSGNIRRVLDPKLQLKDQILLLISSVSGKVSSNDILHWTGYKKPAYFNKLLRQLHDQRYIEFHNKTCEIEMLPPGSEYIAKLLNRLTPHVSKRGS